MKSISQNPCSSQIPTSEESGPVLATRANCICAIPANSPEKHGLPCPVSETEPIPFALASDLDVDVVGLPPVDWSNIVKDPRLEDLEAFETHADACKCSACFRALVRMSNHPDLACLSVS